ncbi:MAG TPA: hypothetical protein VFW94_16925 [Candidatus Acidoferrales bacterium]|nr:hypothetical protein [Candidatus Acidoferrales bacterium]
MSARVPLSAVTAILFALFALCAAQTVYAQENADVVPSGPAAALADALTAACTSNESQFANDLTVESAAAFRALSADERSELIKRFSLADDSGKPLLSSDAQNHTVVRCSTPSTTVEFRFGAARVHDNLAFVPVDVVSGRQTQFGLVRQDGKWRVLSVGLVLIDIPQLAVQWRRAELAPKEDSVIKALQGLKEAIDRYQRAFGTLPKSLAELGPAPPGEISPDQASLVSKDLASGEAGGYRFGYQVLAAPDSNTQATFQLTATPDDYGKTGLRSFFMDADGKIHAADKHGTAATGDDPILEATNRD